jgi:uncharacterized membrane protein
MAVVRSLFDFRFRLRAGATIISWWYGRTFASLTISLVIALFQSYRQYQSSFSRADDVRALMVLVAAVPAYFCSLLALRLLFEIGYMAFGILQHKYDAHMRSGTGRDYLTNTDGPTAKATQVA